MNLANFRSTPEPVAKGGGDGVSQYLQASRSDRIKAAGLRATVGPDDMPKQTEPPDRAVEPMDPRPHRLQARLPGVPCRDALQRHHRSDARDLVTEAPGGEVVHGLVVGGWRAPADQRLGQEPYLAPPRQQRRRHELPRRPGHRLQRTIAVNEAHQRVVARGIEMTLESGSDDQFPRMRSARRQRGRAVLECVTALNGGLNLPAGSVGRIHDDGRELGPFAGDGQGRAEPGDPGTDDQNVAFGWRRARLEVRRRRHANMRP